MLRFQFNKLVRDKIVALQLKDGSRPDYRKLEQAEHINELVAKLIEEAQELLGADKTDVLSEIADLQQILDDLLPLYSLSAKDVTQEQANKNAKYGAFKEGFYVKDVVVHEDNSWVPHYREYPDRYPESPES